MKKTFLIAIALALISMVGSACYEPPTTEPTRIVYVYVPEYRTMWNVCSDYYILQPCYLQQSVYYRPRPIVVSHPFIHHEQVPVRKSK